MNYKNAISFAAILFVAIFVVSPAMATDKYYESKYKPIEPTYNYAQPGAPGFVVFFERGSTVEDHTIWVKNDEQNLTPFDKSFRFDEIKSDAQNAGYGRIIINDDGSSGLIQFAAGNYTAYLQNGNGNQMESQHFQAGAGVTTNVVFLGSAIPTHADPAPVIETPGIKSDIHIIRAEYGALWTTKAAQKYGLTGNGKFVDVTDILQNLVDGGHTSFTFDVANIRDGVSGEVLATLPDDDPVPGVVKNVIVFYSAPHHLVVIPALAMEQDVGGYSYPSYQLPYHPTTTRTTITL